MYGWGRRIRNTTRRGPRFSETRAFARYRLPLNRSSVTIEVVTDVGIELPRINYEQHDGRDYQFAYGTGFHQQDGEGLNPRSSDDFMNQLIKVDVQTGTAHTWY